MSASAAASVGVAPSRPTRCARPAPRHLPARLSAHIAGDAAGPQKSLVMNDEELARILSESHTVAVVGLSDRPDRASHGVARYLQAQGYRIVPVNPRLREVLGETCHPSLAEIPGPVDVVCVFRRAEETPAIAAQAVAGGSRVLWLQEGIVSEEAARVARAGGLGVVMDRCMLKEHRRLRIAAKP